MPRTRVSERTRWEQLANAVIELGQNVRILDERLQKLEGRAILRLDPPVIVHEHDVVLDVQS